MNEDLQLLLEKIQRDGVDKAKAEADVLLKNAKKESASIIAEAKAAAEKFKSDAQHEADASAARAEETIRQSARDVLLDVEKSLTALLEKLLLEDVNQALSSEELVVSLIQEAVTAYINGGSIEVDVAEKMVAALQAKLIGEAAQGVTVVTDATTGSGFRLKLADGRIEHDFTGAAVTAAIARQLRPSLLTLLQS
ncbi:MAG: hypothetical protein PHO37_16630 [Kiritimatiellae bacterium]|nr:hypothetical protein [Kiritimatiellia bacterium]